MLLDYNRTTDNSDFLSSRVLRTHNKDMRIADKLVILDSQNVGSNASMVRLDGLEAEHRDSIAKNIVCSIKVDWCGYRIASWYGFVL